MIRSVLLIDNYDSFTFNIVEALERLGASVRTVRNEIAPEKALELALDARAMILISPGPGRPEDARSCLDIIALAKGKVPLFGVCLGQQAIVLEAGGAVIRAHDVVHGKASLLEHDGDGLFAGLPNPMKVGRYHSLGTPNPPARFRVHAQLDGLAMAVSDYAAKQVGVQFHPESVLTPAGQRLFENVLQSFD
ncbi:MAG TPA: aminodeoxychorismate/anthranilate synthase component II [Sphingomicrobium sp.]|nr:aminodeoxychorismate/anthranilate synthase component II [Sphingomicrobium sp.]